MLLKDFSHTARQTGDHRLVEEGDLPSPSDVLTAQARQNGYGCHRVYRLRPDGLMACEDTDVNRIVAASRSIATDSWVRTSIKAVLNNLNVSVAKEIVVEKLKL